MNPSFPPVITWPRKTVRQSTGPCKRIYRVFTRNRKSKGCLYWDVIRHERVWSYCSHNSDLDPKRKQCHSNLQWWRHCCPCKTDLWRNEASSRSVTKMAEINLRLLAIYILMLERVFTHVILSKPNSFNHFSLLNILPPTEMLSTNQNEEIRVTWHEADTTNDDEVALQNIKQYKKSKWSINHLKMIFIFKYREFCEELSVWRIPHWNDVVSIEIHSQK